jgi:phosphatidylserine decarboxylase
MYTHLTQLRLYASLPLRSMSRLWGYINNVTLPVVLREPVFKLYSFMFGCNLDEMMQPDLTTYENLGQFFYRKLRPDVRRIASPNEALLVFFSNTG